MRLIDAERLADELAVLLERNKRLIDPWLAEAIEDIIDGLPSERRSGGGDMRLIDADEIKLPHGYFEKVDNVPKFYNWLDTLPTVDAEPIRHGHWIFNPKDAIEMMFTLPKCSICGAESSDAGNYCPNCGAKMDEVKDND